MSRAVVEVTPASSRPSVEIYPGTTVEAYVELTPAPEVEVFPVTSPAVVELELTKGLPGEKGEPGEPGAPGSSDGSLLQEHVESLTPHPVYDDGPSFLLLYQNSKV